MERVRLLLNNVFCDEKCLKCGKWFFAKDALPEVYDEQDKLIGYLCDDCLANHQELDLVEA